MKPGQGSHQRTQLWCGVVLLIVAVFTPPSAALLAAEYGKSTQLYNLPDYEPLILDPPPIKGVGTQTPEADNDFRMGKTGRFVFGVGVNQEAALRSPSDAGSKKAVPNAPVRVEPAGTCGRGITPAPLIVGGRCCQGVVPSDEEVLKQLDGDLKLNGRLLSTFKQHRDHVRIEKAKIADYVDPPKLVPLVGPALVHHIHYKCTVILRHSPEFDWPRPSGRKDDAAHAVYLDMRHFHSVEAGELTVPAAHTEPVKTTDDSEEVQRARTPYYLEDDVQYGPPPAHLRLMRELPADAESSAPQGDAESRIQGQLKKKIPVNFDKKPLSEVLDTIGEMTEVKFVIDEPGIHGEGITVDQPVTLKLERLVSARFALSLILQTLHLKHQIVDGTVRVTGESQRNGQLYIKTYNIADLVVPLPSRVSVSLDGARIDLPPQNSLRTSTVAAVYEAREDWMEKTTSKFETLVELITSTIAPTTWDELDGRGEISENLPDLTLVASQTEEVHEEIVDLIEQLRRLQDLQVTLTLETIRIAPGKKLIVDGVDRQPYLEPTDVFGDPAALSNVEAKWLRQVCEATEGFEMDGGPKVTLFNGQTAWIHRMKADGATGSGVLRLQTVVTTDRKSIRMTVAVGEKQMDEGQDEAITTTADDGGSFLFDITGEARTPNGARSEPGERIFLLVSPQIIVATD